MFRLEVVEVSEIELGRLRELVEMLSLYTSALNSFNFSKKQRLLSPKMERLGQFILSEYANALMREIEVEFERVSGRLKELIK
jgi:hypothetical protein